MSTAFGKRLRLLLSVVSVLLAVAAIAAAWFYSQMRASLPQLSGTAAIEGLSGPVTVIRDTQGLPIVRGGSQSDVARALGFVHAQERFFQMDLLRRRSAGELAQLFGSAALPIDRATRVHGFRKLAGQVLARLIPEEREVISAYTDGVNAGLRSLGQKPFEYLVLRTTPRSWQPEDSILVIYSMTLDLQDSTGAYELTLMTLRDQLGRAGVDFFAPLSVPEDAALDGTTGRLGAMPSEKILDLRAPAVSRRQGSALECAAALPDRDPDLFPGSNSFALAGTHTASGVPLLANDPHLELNVPNIWYRSTLEWNQPFACRVSGVTIPGLPAVVIGSNGHIAWSLTDAYADTSDLVSIEVNAIDHSLYKIPGNDELIPIEHRRETIQVKGGDPVTIEVPWTHWGPVVGTSSEGRPLAFHWLAYEPAATDFSFMRLPSSRDVKEAIAIAHRVGMPAHNFVVVDTAGQIAWTIIGRLPNRIGFDGRLPTTWSYGDRRWDGMLPPDEVPTIIGPADGRLWTANNRVIGGDALRKIGDGGFANAPRAVQIRDALTPLQKATVSDLRAIQLDDRALFLERWQKLLLRVLSPEVVGQKRARAELRRLVEHWEGHASIDSVSYRLVRAFRTRVSERALNPIFAGCVDAYPAFDWHRLHYEEALQVLLREKPAHLLDPHYASWDALLLAAADDVIADLDHEGIRLDRATWGRRNTARIHHPFGNILPRWMAGWLNMPADPLPGDSDVPRFQTPSFGASMRMVVSPGREDEGLLHMPGGQSGHPLSPNYKSGHSDWVQGAPTPLLPGPAVHTLTLSPARDGEKK